MKITDIQQQQRNPNRFSIFIDGKYACSLLIEDIQDQDVRVGVELDQARVTQLKRISGDSKLYEQALKKALRRPHSTNEITRYLTSKQASQELIDTISQKLHDLGYLNDVDFAERWYQMRVKAGKSQRYIRGELRSKGVDQQIIDKVVHDDDTTALQQLVHKKARLYQDRQKFIAYLQRKGFSYHDIEAALSRRED